MNEVSVFLHYSDLFGSLVFAISGALVAAAKKMDIFGMAVLATVTAIGGGTLRDMMLNVPAFWLADANAIWISLAATAICFVFSNRLTESATCGLWQSLLP